MSEPSRLPTLGLIAELWYEQAPDLADPAVLAALRAVSPATEAQPISAKQHGSGTQHGPGTQHGSGTQHGPGVQHGSGPQHGSGTQPASVMVPHPLDDPDLPPLLSVVVPGSPLGQDGKSRPDVSQTWDWPQAEEAVARCSASVLVTELLAEGRTATERVSCLGRVVAALADATEPVAIHWARSQRVIDPATFGADDLDGVINVRMVADARDDEALAMDTLGLHVFDLPDIQCHFRGRPPGAVAELLFATAVYLFEHGDVIEDGNTISDTDGEGHYLCYREASLLDPARLVIDVDLGDPYAAGARDRTG